MKKIISGLTFLSLSILNQSAFAQTTPYLDLSLTTFSNGYMLVDYGNYFGARLGGGLQFQKDDRSTFYLAIEGHITGATGEYVYSPFLRNEQEAIKETTTVIDGNIALGAHITRRLDVDLKFGAWLDDPEHKRISDDYYTNSHSTIDRKCGGYLGLGLGFKANQQLLIISDLKLGYASSLSLGLRYNFTPQ